VNINLVVEFDPLTTFCGHIGFIAIGWWREFIFNFLIKAFVKKWWGD